VAETVTRTTGPATKITLEADRKELRADGMDLSFVTVSVADKDGQMVPRSKNRIRLRLKGPARLRLWTTATHEPRIIPIEGRKRL